MNYADAGVSLDANDEAVALIKDAVARAGATRPEVLGSIGGFAAAFAGGFPGVADPVLISATDGVGTKLTIAQTLGRHDTVGFDLVAMVVDDIVCAGAQPLFLLDYLSCGRNEPARTAAIVEGIARACAFAGCALVGGETAEHPGVMDDDEYDLAAFGVGVVGRADLLGPERVRDGDVVIGLASSGLHSNGYSLVRRIILDRDLTLSDPVPGSSQTLGEELLTPCRIHAPAVVSALREVPGAVHAAAHVTGGGIAGNLARSLPPGMGATLDPSSWARHAIFDHLADVGQIAEDEMQRVFNLGLGMLLVVDPAAADEVLAAVLAAGETATVVGACAPGEPVSLYRP